VADIFISYSKPDRDKVVLLAAYLESEGWTVWWDSSLAIGDPYRDEIMKQLATARAVIVLWTPTSVKSDFVRAEAGRAKADGKLIPVKDGVSYGDIPLPFGEMHTEDLSKRELIRAAVVAQLAKPQAQPSALWMASKTLRYQVLTWVGIVGGAVTVFANLRGVLDLANWARLLVLNWQKWSLAFWHFSLSWLGITLPKALAPILTFLLFSVVTAVGARRLANSDDLRPSTDFVRRIAIWMVIAFFGCLIFVPLAVGLLIRIGQISDDASGQMILHGASGPIVLFTAFMTTLPLVVLHRGQRLAISAFLALVVVFFAVIVLAPAEVWMDSFTALIAQYYGDAQKWMYALLIWLAPREEFYAKVPLVGSAVLIFLISASLWLLFFAQLIMLWICPLHALTKRLAFLAIGVAVLVGLNQLSLHGAVITGWLKPPI
jgi:hypothetical protein